MCAFVCVCAGGDIHECVGVSTHDKHVEGQEEPTSSWNLPPSAEAAGL